MSQATRLGAFLLRGLLIRIYTFGSSKTSWRNFHLYGNNISADASLEQSNLHIKDASLMEMTKTERASLP